MYIRPYFCTFLYILTLAKTLPSLHAGQSPASGPRLEITPSTSVVYLNSNGPSTVFTCRTAGDKPDMFSQLKWNGPNQLDNWDELRKRHSITEESHNSWDLELIKPTADDSGTYYCRGTYQSSDALNASIVIKVVNAIRLENCHDRQFLVKGHENGRITCRITGDAPRVTILKNNTRIEDFAGRYRWDYDDGLVINGPIEDSDAGVYLLKITNDITGQREIQPINVQVHSGPEILPHPQNLSELFGIESERAELRCIAKGNPKPLVYWYDLRLRNLTSVGGYHVNPEEGTLLIDRVNRVDDNGQFRCTAHNHVGSASKVVNMVVYIRPRIENFDNKTTDEYSEVTFECRSTGYPPPQFSIRRHGINQLPYKIGDGVLKDMNTTPEGGGSDVHVHRATIVANRSHFGLHYCNASNKAGSAERVSQLFVNFRPDLSSTPGEQYFKLGQNTTLRCHIKSYPKPTVAWFSDGTQILNVDSNFEVSPDEYTHIVNMRPPMRQQTAFNRFVCKAQNFMGSDERSIVQRYITRPGTVTVAVVDRTPTTVKLQLMAPNDGGSRIKFYKYRATGRTLDMHNPIYSFREDIQKETILEASLNPTVPYTIRSLLPYYAYTLSFSAVNDVGDGDETDIHIETQRATRPDPPVIVRPNVQTFNQQSASGVLSDYRNGYLLKWSPPELDNGDMVRTYLIKFKKLDSDLLDIPMNMADERIVEQMSDRPMYAKIGPLETNRRYKIQIQARNNYGDSEPVHIIVQTTQDRPEMSEFQSLPLTRLVNQIPTLVLFILLVVAIMLLVLIDLTFCLCCKIGVGYQLQRLCCPLKTKRVISDKNYD